MSHCESNESVSKTVSESSLSSGLLSPTRSSEVRVSLLLQTESLKKAAGDEFDKDLIDDNEPLGIGFESPLRNYSEETDQIMDEEKADPEVEKEVTVIEKKPSVGMAAKLIEDDKNVKVDQRFINLCKLYGYEAEVISVDLMNVDHDETIRMLTESFVLELVESLKNDVDEAIKGMTATPFLLYHGDDGRQYLLDGNHRCAAIRRFFEFNREAHPTITSVKAILLNVKPKEVDCYLLCNTVSIYQRELKREWSVAESLKQSYVILTSDRYSMVDGAKSIESIDQCRLGTNFYNEQEIAAIHVSLVNMLNLKKTQLFYNVANFVYLTENDFDQLITILKSTVNIQMNQQIWNSFISKYRFAPRGAMAAIAKAFPVNKECANTKEICKIIQDVPREAWPIFKNYALYDELISYEESLRIIVGKDIEVSIEECEAFFMKFYTNSSWKTNAAKGKRELKGRLQLAAKKYKDYVEGASGTAEKCEEKSSDAIPVEKLQEKTVEKRGRKRKARQVDDNVEPKKLKEIVCSVIGCPIHDELTIERSITYWINQNRMHAAALFIYNFVSLHPNDLCDGIEERYPWYEKFIKSDGTFHKKYVPKDEYDMA